MNEDKPRELKDRTKEFALRIVRLYAALPKTTVAQVLGKQMLRSGTSVGAHYREGMFGRSDAEFVSKLEGALQELGETICWEGMTKHQWPMPNEIPSSKQGRGVLRPESGH